MLASSLRFLFIQLSPIQEWVLRRWLSASMTEATCFSASTADAFTVIRDRQPDVVLIEPSSLKSLGPQWLSVVKNAFPRIGIFCLTNETVTDSVESFGCVVDGYVAQSNLHKTLIPAIDNFLQTIARQSDRLHPVSSTEQFDLRLQIVSDLDRISSTVSYVENYLRGSSAATDKDRHAICAALQEALSNAMYYGTLQLDPMLREANEDPFYELAK